MPSRPRRPGPAAGLGPDCGTAGAGPGGSAGLSVWATAQQTGPSQRRGRYLPDSVGHPARMLPAIAAHAITTYTRPGELVFDPMCGIGTTLVEAVHAGRDVLGVEYEPRWAEVADANLAHARGQGATGRGGVVRGDATRLAGLLPAALAGHVALVVTSPPYGPTVHGHVRPTPQGVRKTADRYGEDRANLAYRDLPGLVAGITGILAGCQRLLRPGGMVVVTARPWRRHGELVDLPSAVIAAGERAGLAPTERCVALLAAVRDGHLVPRPSFFQLQAVRKARAAGIPLHLIAHEDVLVFTNSTWPGGRVIAGGIRRPAGRPPASTGHRHALLRSAVRPATPGPTTPGPAGSEADPPHPPAPPAPIGDVVKNTLTVGEIADLPAVVDLLTAGRALGIGRTVAYELARRGQFPCRLLRVGSSYRVPVADLKQILGLHAATTPAGRGVPAGPAAGSRTSSPAHG